MTRRQFVLLILPLLLVLAGFVALHLVERVGGIGSPAWDADFSDFVRRRMEREFVFGLGDEEKQEAAYFAALTEYLHLYDRYGEVIPPDAVARAREESSGQYYGIGVRQELYPQDVELPIEAMKVVGVKPGGPADKAGIKLDEFVVSVNGRPVSEFAGGTKSAEEREDALTEISAAIKGERNTTVRLGVRGVDGMEREVEVPRDAVSQGSVFGVRFLDQDAGIA
ncbi:MAG: S41 family peptidase, partial [Planctomycetota bacterium]